MKHDHHETHGCELIELCFGFGVPRSSSRAASLRQNLSEPLEHRIFVELVLVEWQAFDELLDRAIRFEWK